MIDEWLKLYYNSLLVSFLSITNAHRRQQHLLSTNRSSVPTGIIPHGANYLAHTPLYID